jgi:hypothetical protein
MTFPLARNELRPELLLEHVPGLKCRQRVERGSAHGERAAGAHTDTRVQAEGRPFPAPAPARMAVPGRRDRGPGPPLLPGTAVLNPLGRLLHALLARVRGLAPRASAPPVRRWRETGAIPGHAKACACLSLIASWLVLLSTRAPDVVKIGCLPLFVAMGLFFPRGRTVDDHVRPELRSSCPVLTPRSRTSRDCAAGRRPSP